jgi:8-oxo-dGTP pyrophosphatase MutT (NUDIX family)
VERTWDGLPVAQERPWVSAVVVWREGPEGREFLLLHRHHRGPEFAGDWAWTSPAGARQPGETPDDAARRELLEETGLTLSLRGRSTTSRTMSHSTWRRLSPMPRS